MDVTMPHSCEVTIAHLDDALERYAARFDEADRHALHAAAVVLGRIATEDRERMANEISD